MKLGKIFRAVVLGLLVSTISSDAFAITKSFQADSFRPNGDVSNYITVFGSNTLSKWQWNTGTTASYAYRPFQLTTGGKRAQGIVDNILVQHFYVSAGIFADWLQAGLELPVGWWIYYDNPNLTGINYSSHQALGDLQIDLKARLLDIEKYNVGVSVLPFMMFPTGDGKYYFGNGVLAGGGKLILEFRPVDIFTVSLNAGVLAREKFSFRDMEVGKQFLYGLGTAVTLGKGVSLAGEVTGSAKLSNPFKKKNETPVEAIVGVKWKRPKCGITLNAGGGAGIIRGSGAPTFRTFIGISYTAKD